MATTKHPSAGNSSAIAAPRSVVKVAMPHCRGRWLPRRATRCRTGVDGARSPPAPFVGATGAATWSGRMEVANGPADWHYKGGGPQIGITRDRSVPTIGPEEGCEVYPVVPAPAAL